MDKDKKLSYGEVKELMEDRFNEISESVEKNKKTLYVCEIEDCHSSESIIKCFEIVDMEQGLYFHPWYPEKSLETNAPTHFFRNFKTLGDLEKMIDEWHAECENLYKEYCNC